MSKLSLLVLTEFTDRATLPSLPSPHFQGPPRKFSVRQSCYIFHFPAAKLPASFPQTLPGALTRLIMATSEQENDFGDALWNDKFYTSSSVISGLSSSNHIYNLKKTVLPNSALSQLISAYLQDSPKQSERLSNLAKPGSLQLTKSGPLQASPSLIALEKILNKEDAPNSPLPQTIIEEEEESAPLENEVAYQEKPVLSRPYEAQKSALTLSVTTFQTASSERPGHFEYPLPEHHSASAATLSPIPDSQDGTPELGPDHQTELLFDTSNSTPTYEPISVSPSLSLKSTGAERPSQYPVSNRTQRTPETTEVVKSTKAFTKHVKDPPANSPRRSGSFKNPNPPVPKQNSGNSKLDKKKQLSMLDAFNSSDAKKSSPSKNLLKAKAPAVSKLIPSKNTVKEHTRKKTPQQSSNAKAEETKEAGKPKPAPEKPINTKRFSFRTMFKSKSKNHSLSQMNPVKESLEPSRPVKLSHKSTSTPDFGSFKKPANASLAPTYAKATKPEARKSLFTRRKSDANASYMASMTKTPYLPEKGSTPEPSRPVATERDKPLPEASSPSISPPKASTPKLTPSVMSKKSPALEQKSAASPSVFSADSPSAAILHPGETIREVDDLDFLPEQFQDTSRVNAEFADTDSSPEATPHVSMSGPQSSLLGQSLDPKNPLDMGSPFSFSYDADSYTGEKGRSFSDSPRIGPSMKSTSNRSLNAQLAGEALFPKLLNPHEVESIVSIERSRSMRSIKSNTKRSSFINYTGSDENIVFGNDVGILRQASMKNSGGILKNSLSNRELRGDLLSFDGNDSFKSTPKETSKPETSKPETSKPEPVFLDTHEKSPASVNGERFTDFIEFTDYIDIENLDFAASPSIRNRSVASSRRSSEVKASDIHIADSSIMNESTTDLPTQEHETESSVSMHDEDVGKAAELGTPDMRMVSTTSSPEKEPSETAQLSSASPSQQIASPLDRTYEFAVETSQTERNTSKGPRPVSMSFKGFKGSVFKDKVLVQSGSHQLIHFDHDLYENSPVGQGFGTSEEDSTSEMEVESPTVSTSEDSLSFTLQSNQRYSVNNNSTSSNNRRQQHMRNVLNLQPPRSSVPFHHNRIPSISDHSAASSPKLLGSFMSRIRKSPKALPNVTSLRPRVSFSSRIILYDTYHQDDYDRHPEIGTCNQLTPLLAQQIKDELNELKANMEVHSDSICYTQFF